MAISRVTQSGVRTARIRRAGKVLVVVALIAAVVIAGVAIVPEVLPNLIQAVRQNPIAPLLVAACWLLATTAAIAGKRALARGHLSWFETTPRTSWGP